MPFGNNIVHLKCISIKDHLSTQFAFGSVFLYKFGNIIEVVLVQILISM